MEMNSSNENCAPDVCQGNDLERKICSKPAELKRISPWTRESQKGRRREIVEQVILEIITIII
jgi:hypothetical protein